MAEARLDRAVPLVTAGHAAAILGEEGFQSARALGTWEGVELVKGDVLLRVPSMPGRHGPALVSRLMPPVMGSLLEFETAPGDVALRLYISGDTMVHGALREIQWRYPDIDLALLHLGGARILGIMVTMDGDQEVEAMQVARPHALIPIQCDDSTVFSSPLDDLKRAVEAAGLEERVRTSPARRGLHVRERADPPRPSRRRSGERWHGACPNGQRRRSRLRADCRRTAERRKRR